MSSTGFSSDDIHDLLSKITKLEEVVSKWVFSLELPIKANGIKYRDRKKLENREYYEDD